MSRFFAPVATTGFVLLFAAAVSAQTQNQTENETQAQAQSQIQAEPQQPVSVSKVRIVRISEVRGTVQLDRSNGHNFEPAIANLPVIEKNRLKTATGIAEVEFEDNSSLRLGPDSEVQFVELGRTSAGATISTVRVVRGTAYVSLVKAGSKAPVNEFKLSIGDRTIQLQPDTHLRLNVGDLHASLAVLNGTIHLDSPNGNATDSGTDIPHKKTVSFALIGDTKPTVASNIETDPLDAWDKQHDQFHSRAASLSAFGGSPYAYGLSDMNYYGSFADSGCGTMWRPYFTSAGWDPFSNGTWAYYSGAGYSWVSPYPWAWTPYHYGSWSFCPGSGWGWMPGGSWSGLNNITASSTIPREPVNPIHPVKGGGPNLPTAPRAGQPSMISISHSAIVPSGATSSGSFVFRNDSAGLGVPRGELGNLRGFSEHAGRSGQASTPVYYSGGSSTPNEARGVSTLAPVSVHRGFAPPPVSSGGFSSFGSVSGGASMRAPSTSIPVSSGPAPSTGGAHR